MLALTILAFVTGALTVLAPCVLPLLPIIIGGSVGEQTNRSYPYIIAASLATSLFAFTIILKASTAATNISPDTWVYISGVIVVGLGLVSIFPHAWEVLMFRLGLQAKTQSLLDKSSRTNNSTLRPVLTGIALGPVFSSCSPTYAFILATVLPRDTSSGVFYLLVYCLGLVLALLGLSLAGRRAIGKAKWAANPYGWFRRSLGALFILVGLTVITGQQQNFQVWAANHLPDIGGVDKTLLLHTTKRTVNKAANKGSDQPDLSNKKLFNVEPYAAPELTGLTDWINSKPLTLKELRGKVVLVDFWTYSCINCIRTLPHVTAWYNTYKDDGFVVIGVHAPEFSFEHVPANVQEAVSKDKIKYPVALDNNFDTWSAYQNQYWPAHYLIDKSGNVVNEHFGEGKYDETEQAIKILLGDKSKTMTDAKDVEAESGITPETYFGLQRAANNAQDLHAGRRKYVTQTKLGRDTWALGGTWDVGADGITASNNSTLTFRVHAKEVYVVAEPTNHSRAVGVEITGALSRSAKTDIKNGTITVDESRLYHLASFDDVKDATITLKPQAGVIFHTFTFG